VDGCDPATGCTKTNVTSGAPCDDGEFCTLSDACSNGVCTGVTLRDCGGAVTGPCLTASCNETLNACVVMPMANLTACNDGDPCTGNDRCSAGQCVGQQRVGCVACSVAADCDDSQDCTTDLCDDLTGTCDYLYAPGCVPVGTGGTGGGTGAAGAAGFAGAAGAAPDAGSDAPSDAGQDVSSGGSGGAGGGSIGTGGMAGIASGSDGQAASGSGAVDGGGNSGNPAEEFYKKDEYGSCACRAPASPAAPPAALYALAALACGALQRRRRRT
jgi:hypothetical protein